jgi:hypothetical protein
MDLAFGHGQWSAESHSFSEGALTVTGIKASVPPSLETHLALRAAASAKAQAIAEAAMAEEAAAAALAQAAAEAEAEAAAEENAWGEFPDSVVPDGSEFEAPVIGDDQNSSDGDAPDGGVNTPLAGDGAPAAGDDVSAAEDEAPATGEEAPAAGEEAPAAGEEAPAAGEEAPAAGDEAPAAGEEAPAAGEEAPAAGDEAPAAGEEAPAAGEEAPAAGEEAPAAGVVPISGIGAPTANDEAPDGGHSADDSDASGTPAPETDGTSTAPLDAVAPAAPSTEESDAGNNESGGTAAETSADAATRTDTPDDGAAASPGAGGDGPATGDAASVNADDETLFADDAAPVDAGGDTPVADGTASADAGGETPVADGTDSADAGGDTPAPGDTASGEAAARPARDPDAPAADRPGLTIKSVKVTGLAPGERLAAAAGNSGAPLDVFKSLAIEDLKLHTGESPERGAAELRIPGASLGRLSCRPSIGKVYPDCSLDSLDAGDGFAYAFVYPEGDPRWLLRMAGASLSAEGLAAGGAAGLTLSSFKVARARAERLEAQLASDGAVLGLGAVMRGLAAEGLEGLYSARLTEISGMEIYLDGTEDTLFQAAADRFRAEGLDLRDSMADAAARPGAGFLNEFLSEDGGGLMEALWPAWDCLFSQRYSAESWSLEGLKATGADGDRLEAKAVTATGPFVRGRLSERTSLEMEQAELEFPADPWHPEAQVNAARFLGSNVLQGDLRVTKSWDAEKGTLRWRLDPLDVRDLGRLTLDITLSGMSELAVERMADVRLRNIDRLLAAAAAQGLGVGGLELTLEGTPVIDRTVLTLAEAMDAPPYFARTEISTRVSLTLLNYLSNFASVESVISVTDAITDYIDKPREFTLTLAPASPLDAVALAAGGEDPVTLIRLLNLSVSSNGGQPQPLVP